MAGLSTIAVGVFVWFSVPLLLTLPVLAAAMGLLVVLVSLLAMRLAVQVPRLAALLTLLCTVASILPLIVLFDEVPTAYSRDALWECDWAGLAPHERTALQDEHSCCGFYTIDDRYGSTMVYVVALLVCWSSRGDGANHAGGGLCFGHQSFHGRLLQCLHHIKHQF